MSQRGIIAGALLSVVLCVNAFTQDASFDVVSIKPSPPDSNMSRTSWDPGRLLASGVNLKQLIEWAYKVTDAQVAGGPGWMDSKFFDLEAKAEGRYDREQLLRMLQPALADRFKLSLHRETREMPVYVLTSGSSLPELHEAKGGPSNIQIQAVPPVAGERLVLRVIGQSVSMQYLTSYLTGPLGRLVLDRTGLKNAYDFKAEIPIDEADIINEKRAAVNTTLWNAMSKLGLKLDSRKEPVEVLVIDHVEEPSTN
jgi:uncharacterized protein (TIGR03435 family)